MGKIRKYRRKTAHKVRGGTTCSHVLSLEQRETTVIAPLPALTLLISKERRPKPLFSSQGLQQQDVDKTPEWGIFNLKKQSSFQKLYPQEKHNNQPKLPAFLFSDPEHQHDYRPTGLQPPHKGKRKLLPRYHVFFSSSQVFLLWNLIQQPAPPQQSFLITPSLYLSHQPSSILHLPAFANSCSTCKLSIPVSSYPPNTTSVALKKSQFET